MNLICWRDRIRFVTRALVLVLVLRPKSSAVTAKTRSWLEAQLLAPGVSF